MQPQRERVKLGKERTWWRVLPVVGAIGLIGLMLVLTLMPSDLDDASLTPSAVALLGAPTPSSQPSAPLIAAPFPTKLPELPSIDLLPAGPGEIKLATALPASTTTVGPTSLPTESVLLPTLVQVIDSATATVPVATEVAGPTIHLPNTEFQATVMPLPTDVPIVEQPSLPTILPPRTQPVALFGDRFGTTVHVQRIDTDQALESLTDDGISLFMRYNQPPFVLQRPQPKTWQLVDLATQQTVEWHFEKIIGKSAFMAILAPNYHSMLTVLGHDMRSNDQFLGASQLVHINTQTGVWNVIADSETWPELKWAKLLAWHGDTVYFLQTSKNPQILWRTQLGPPFKAEPIAEIPSIVANVPDVNTAIFAALYVSPNQRWLIYSLVAANNTMVLRVLDLVNQRSHDIALPVMVLRHFSFSPDGNSFAVMLPTVDGNDAYPALYQLEQQRWYQLDQGRYLNGSESISPFLWSPDGRWLAVNFGPISREAKLSVYNIQQSRLAFSTNFDAMSEPIGLYNDGTTMLMRSSGESSLEQRTWSNHAWQINWRINAPISQSAQMYYVYPR